MRALIPDTLAGRTIAILVLGLGLFHLWSIWIYQIGTENLLGSRRDGELAGRLIVALHALDALPPIEREGTAHALSDRNLDIHWSPMSLVTEPAANGEQARALRVRLHELAPELTENRLRFGYADEPEQHHHLLLVSAQLKDGTWVTFGLDAFRRAAAAEHDVLGSLTAMAVGILLVSILLVRSINAPLRTLGDAADRIGADLGAAGAPEVGPREIRQVARAFNAMQARIRRLIDDRTQTLAAISHDLKTPLTRLRLRAGFLDDVEARRTIEADLDEMERMLDSALAFLRGEATEEASRTIDVMSVLRTICDQLLDAGHEVILLGPPRAPLACRPTAIKRALANLLDNAVKYGRRAHVTVDEQARELRLVIDDEGPGVPAVERERVFDPFYRLEASRSRDTGGTGLGLTIARTVIRAHGGEIVLADAPTGGLRVAVTLPTTARS